MKPKRDHLPIGTPVQFSHRAKRWRSEKDEITFIRAAASDRKGIIIGGVYRQEGRVESATYDEGNGGGYEQPYLVVKQTVFLYRVATSFLGKPVEVFPGDVIVLKEPPKIPFGASGSSEWTKEDRRILSENSKAFPRDEKGRFK